VDAHGLLKKITLKLGPAFSFDNRSAPRLAFLLCIFSNVQQSAEAADGTCIPFGAHAALTAPQKQKP
jgi:hypothetical protein